MIQIILQKFTNQLLQKAASDIAAIIWFGSTARDQTTDDSDIDVLVIGREENIKIRDIAFDVAADLSLEYDCLISVLFISKSRFEEMKSRGRLLARNIENDGICLWENAA